MAEEEIVAALDSYGPTVRLLMEAVYGQNKKNKLQVLEQFVPKERAA